MVHEIGSTAGLSALAIGAHPDDVELGCGGTLAKLTRAGAQVRVVILSRGRRGGLNDADRAEETRTALGTLGITDIAVHDFPDTRLSEHLNELIEVLDRHVEEVRLNLGLGLIAGIR